MLCICYVLVLLAGSTLSLVTAQAPGDEDELCTVTLPSVGQNVMTYSPNIKPLMDSFHYEDLLPPPSINGIDPTWQRVDIDGIDNVQFTSTWTEQGGEACRTSVTVCGFSTGIQNNWLITQFINRTVNGARLPQVVTLFEYQLTGCPMGGACQRTFVLHKYERSSVNKIAAIETDRYQFVNRLTTRDSGVTASVTENINFDTDNSGFYLGVQDESTCILISRLLVYYHVCPGEISNLVMRPETIAPSIGNGMQIQVTAKCIANARPRASKSAKVICLERGVWFQQTVTVCVCEDGYIESNDGKACLPCDPGTYAKMSAGICEVCPANSNSTVHGLTMCPCIEGSYRLKPTEIDLPCTFAVCETPPPISNGSPGTPTSTLLGGTVTYTCNNGYQISPGVTIVTASCLATGNWETIPTCSEPRVRFMLRGIMYLNNSAVTLNHIGEGDNALLCVTNNTDCCKPPNGNTGQGEFYYPNQTLVRVNSKGDSLYRNRGPQVVRLHRRNNALSPTGVYRCEIPDSSGMNQNIYINIITIVDCETPPSISNGSPGTPTSTLLGGTVTYTCNNGYQISLGITIVTASCMATENWETIPTCSALCPSLSHPTNGVVDYNSDLLSLVTIENTVATYSCDNGFLLIGEGTRTCQPDKTWSSTAPYCTDYTLVQLRFAPTDNCIRWNEKRASQISFYMRNIIQEAILTKGSLTIPLDHIEEGLFSCHTHQDQTIFRTRVIGTQTVSAVDAGTYVQKWVESGPAVRVGWYIVFIDKTCPVSISSLTEAECGKDVKFQRCVDMCVAGG